MTTITDCRAVKGGCRVKTLDGQRVFLKPGANDIEIDGWSAVWTYTETPPGISIRGAQPIAGKTITLSNVPKKRPAKKKTKARKAR